MGATYSSGGNSGKGSYGKHAKFKSRVINEFVRKHAIGSVLDFGAGDGNQLAMLKIPRYVGLDVSSTAIELLKQHFVADKAKEFWLCENGIPEAVRNDSFDLTMSLDVIYHLIEDAVFEQYMRDLFEASNRFVIIYASDNEATDVCDHVKHRCFSNFVTTEITGWRFFEKIENPYKPKSPSDFYIYERIGSKA